MTTPRDSYHRTTLRPKSDVAGRVLNVRLRTAMAKDKARRLLDLQAPPKRRVVWFYPGHWSYPVAIGACIAVLVVALAGLVLLAQAHPILGAR